MVSSSHILIKQLYLIKFSLLGGKPCQQGELPDSPTGMKHFVANRDLHFEADALWC